MEILSNFASIYCYISFVIGAVIMLVALAIAAMGKDYEPRNKVHFYVTCELNYRGGWLPNGLSDVHGIEMYYDPSNGVVKVRVIKCHIISKFLSFQTEERAKEFLTNFRELIEQAWDLI